MQFDLNGLFYSIDEYEQGFAFTSWRAGRCVEEGKFWPEAWQAQAEALRNAQMALWEQEAEAQMRSIVYTHQPLEDFLKAITEQRPC